MLARIGLVELDTGLDRRRRLASLTERGAETLAAATPLWRGVQRRMAEGLGLERDGELRRDLGAVVRAAYALSD